MLSTIRDLEPAGTVTRYYDLTVPRTQLDLPDVAVGAIDFLGDD